jgi:hypothetical protein
MLRGEHVAQMTIGRRRCDDARRHETVMSATHDHRMITRIGCLGLVLATTLAACAASPAASTTPATQRPLPASPASPATGSSSASRAPQTAGEPSPEASTTATPEADGLLATVLTDVRSGEVFTLGELARSDGPVLLEPMAVWCSSCLEQQRQIGAAHASGQFISVSLDVDLSESPDQLAGYADDERFDWPFAMAEPALYRLLQDRFGTAATHPPSTPLIVVERDGSVRPLAFGAGIRSSSEILAEVTSCSSATC